MLGLAWLFGCAAKRNRQCAKSVGSIATKSMTVKNGGNTIDAVEGLALWVSHCISRACALAGWDSFPQESAFSKDMVKVLPEANSLSKLILPPCASINSLLIARPSPVPSFFVPGTRKYRSNILSLY